MSALATATSQAPGTGTPAAAANTANSRPTTPPARVPAPAALGGAGLAGAAGRTGNDHGFLFVVSGPSGAGKGTLVAHLLSQRPDCVFSVSATTRPRRNTELEGREYVFLDRASFERRRAAGEFLEWAEVHGNLYGTPVNEVDAHVRAGRVVVLDVDVQGGASVRRARPDAVSVFVYPPTLDQLRDRLEARGTDAPEVIEQRMNNAPGELAQWKFYDYVVMNDSLERAQAELLAIHDAEHARVHRLRLT